jgi:hypothetical protein
MPSEHAVCVTHAKHNSVRLATQRLMTLRRTGALATARRKSVYMQNNDTTSLKLADYLHFEDSTTPRM